MAKDEKDQELEKDKEQIKGSKYYQLITQDEEEAKEIDAEYKAQQARYELDGKINDLKLQISDLEGQLSKAKQAVPLDADTITQLQDELQLTHRRLGQMKDVRKELFGE